MNLIESMSSDVAESKKSLVLLPVGSLEQHGSEAPLGCDGIIADQLCIRTGEATGCSVLPGLYYGLSDCHTAFPGTFSLSVKTYTSLIENLLREAGRNGYRSIMIVSGHGGNRSGVEKALSASTAQMKMEYLGYWELPGYTMKEEELFGKTGHHITTSEVSMVWHLLGRPIPGLFTGRYPKAVSTIGDFSPEEWKECYPDGGVGGDMTRASVKKGEILFNYTLGLLVEKVKQEIARQA